MQGGGGGGLTDKKRWNKRSNCMPNPAWVGPVARALYRRSLAQARAFRHQGARVVTELEIKGRWRRACALAAHENSRPPPRRVPSVSGAVGEAGPAAPDALTGAGATGATALSVVSPRAGAAAPPGAPQTRGRTARPAGLAVYRRLRVAACTLRMLQSAVVKMNLPRALLINMMAYREVRG
jgi:hypothetical protein